MEAADGSRPLQSGESKKPSQVELLLQSGTILFNTGKWIQTGYAVFTRSHILAGPKISDTKQVAVNSTLVIIGEGKKIEPFIKKTLTC